MAVLDYEKPGHRAKSYAYMTIVEVNVIPFRCRSDYRILKDYGNSCRIEFCRSGLSGIRYIYRFPDKQY